jgi:hypothetical protein
MRPFLPRTKIEQQAKARMQNPLRLAAASLAFMLACGAIGCTIYGEKKPPTLASTTSAEQYERILWQMVEKQQWNKIPPLLSTTLVWNVDGKSLTSGQVVPWLQSLNLKGALVNNASVQPNGPDMTVIYTLQISGARGGPQDFSVFTVWQQMKNGSYILIAHSEQAASAPATASVR